MNVLTMRRVDIWVGVPACILLTVFRYAGDAFRRPVGRPQRPVRSILFVKLAEQGATVLARPAIQRAIQLVGRERVYFVVFEENRFILDVMEILPAENVITIRTGGLVGTLLRTLSAVGQLRRIRPDATVDFEFFARSSAILAYLSGARTRVGLHGQGDNAPFRGDLLTERLKYNPKLHTADTYLSMVDAIAPQDAPKLKHDEGVPTFRARADEREKLDQLLTELAGGAYSPLVLLNSNASDLLPLRRWPTERYVELAQGLLGYSDQLHVAFTGAPTEAAATQEIVQRVGHPRCFSVAGKTTLRELFVLYCLADLLVTNDSGPAHFASLTPIEVITLFGPETPALFGARTPRAHNVWRDLPCSPCVSAYNNRLTTCTDNQCMQRITVQEILDLAGSILHENGLIPEGTGRTAPASPGPRLPVLSPDAGFQLRES